MQRLSPSGIASRHIGRLGALGCLIVAGLAFVLPAHSEEPATGRLEVVVTGLKSDEGSLMVALVNSAEMFSAGKETVREARTPIQGGRASVAFEALPYGPYAVKSFHDENDNGKLDTNFVGFPKEGFGFSNDAMGRFGPPTFEDARFELKAPELTIEIHSK